MALSLLRTLSFSLRHFGRRSGRSAALVLLLISGAFASGAQETPNSGRWQFTRTADPIEGGSIAMASVAAEGADALVRCWTKTRELDLRFLLAPGSGRAASEKVTIGFDKRRYGVRNWRLSPSGLALVVPPSQRRQLLNRLQEARTMRLFVQTSALASADSDDAAEGMQLDIPLAGSSRAIAGVLKACN